MGESDTASSHGRRPAEPPAIVDGAAQAASAIGKPRAER